MSRFHTVAVMKILHHLGCTETVLGALTEYSCQANTKSGVVTFSGTKLIHSQLMRVREWMLGESVVDELFQYKNLGVLKNYVSSFASNVDDNIEKARKRLV